MYQDVQLFIDGVWCDGAERRAIDVLNPADETVLGQVARAERADLDAALAAAQRGFAQWRRVSAWERAGIMRRAAQLLRERAAEIAQLMTLEQGKPLAEANGEAMSAADLIDWFADEGRRAYGKLVPSRIAGSRQMVIKEPVGPVAAFSPWNFPINQVVRKLSAALAAGCSIVVKAPEETPAAPAALIRAFADAGVPAGVINLVFGDPAEISSYLIPHPVIRKVSFTGSTVVGKQLAALAGQHMKRVTMELGGHGPVLVFDDADVETAAAQLAAFKLRNAGQVCTSPTRFLIQRGVFERFADAFEAAIGKIRIGDGLADGTTMGPLANVRRLHALEGLVDDAVSNGATLRAGGKRIGERGYFFAPTMLTDVPAAAKIMSEEPFGPIAVLNAFDSIDAMIDEANRLPYGLCAFAYTRSQRTAHRVIDEVETGMLTLNQIAIAFPEVPFGGVKDSGYGTEGGAEALDAYLNLKYVSQLDI
ncbi:NAD-dependent succinate-semialdehyde dehydrogenase [Burkholderia sp. Ac-20379]|uniref:NAD-dependent succinate-semialdehyde dehydrogenase n=1 Tax=Burkholderia sp. Ac-20379 TaxID=2703900 RepID=UPI00197DCF98|nr:NAD-dependent succinate-semialdehyde dehydrogenase [Burkholderia sp. Ac-20379]MBN3723283.1 NAD-dependent succinate-semialdehyde dehydrogenase [Burkholderia sp. Ac-20379]